MLGHSTDVVLGQCPDYFALTVRKNARYASNTEALLAK